jgi:L-lactate dehydrogenase
MPGLQPTIAIVGCGAVGMSYAYALIIKGLARKLVLVDVDRNRIEGEAMDLAHGAPYISPVEIIAGDYPDIAGADLVVITAGRKQKPGQTRTDLVTENTTLYKTIIPSVVAHAPQALLLIASNPVDVMSYAAWRISGKPAHEVIGSGTVLDSARFRYQLAQHCGIDPRSIHAYVLGEHGDSEFPLWSRAMVGSALFSEYCGICKQHDQCTHTTILQRIFTDVRDSAYRIIEKKGATSYGIGLALVRITQAILHDENSVLPVSSLQKDSGGEGDVYLSVPAVVNRAGIKEVLNVGMTPGEEVLLRKSADVIRQAIRQAGLYA